MVEKFAVPVICAAEKLNLISAAYKADMPRTATRLFHLMIDNPDATMWSTDRLAKAIKRCVRTVERALAALRSFGVLRTVRRGRKQTLVKVLVLSAILTLGKIGAAASKKACETRAKVSWRVLPDRWRQPVSSVCFKKAEQLLASIAKVGKSDASSSLLRSRLARPG